MSTLLVSSFDIAGLTDDMTPRQPIEVIATGPHGEKHFTMTSRIDTPVELDYYRHGGILAYVVRKLLG